MVLSSSESKAVISCYSGVILVRRAHDPGQLGMPATITPSGEDESPVTEVNGGRATVYRGARFCASVAFLPACIVALTLERRAVGFSQR